MRGTPFVLVFFLLSPFALNATDEKPVENSLTDDKLGFTIKNAIEVCEPKGERQYLSRLVCQSGKYPGFHRLGSFDTRNPIPEDMSEEEQERLFASIREKTSPSPGGPDYHVIDGYEVRCDGEKVTLYLDMYHCAQPAPAVAPSGFSIIN